MPAIRHLTAAAVLLSGLTSFAADLPQTPGEPSPEFVEYGRQVFEFNFARPDRLPEGVKLGDGNGLGPLFNDVSCVSCHKQGGVGGSGDLDSNVFMLGIVVRPIPEASIDQIINSAQTIHSGLTDTKPTIVIQKFAVGSPDIVDGYDAWRTRLMNWFGADAARVKPIRKEVGAATLELAQRNTPALWGMGIIENFRKEGGEKIRQRIADEIHGRRPWISGRPPVSVDGVEGWFGWRGQILTLDDMILAACATECGLQVPGAQEAAFPRGIASAKRALPAVSRGADLTPRQIAALIGFVAAIPPPQQAALTGQQEVQTRTGERVFDRIGCSDCHVKDLGWVRGVYSDLLLHDMGDSDEDIQLTNPPKPKVTLQLVVGQSIDYSGGPAFQVAVVPVVVNGETIQQEQEWKTPPLWGVSDSAPYFHDGRAATLASAIEMHDGEARHSGQAYRELDEDDRSSLLAFLSSLKAPANDPNTSVVQRP